MRHMARKDIPHARIMARVQLAAIHDRRAAFPDTRRTNPNNPDIVIGQGRGSGEKKRHRENKIMAQSEHGLRNSGQYTLNRKPEKPLMFQPLPPALCVVVTFSKSGGW